MLSLASCAPMQTVSTTSMTEIERVRSMPWHSPEPTSFLATTSQTGTTLRLTLLERRRCEYTETVTRRTTETTTSRASPGWVAVEVVGGVLGGALMVAGWREDKRCDNTLAEGCNGGSFGYILGVPLLLTSGVAVLIDLVSGGTKQRDTISQHPQRRSSFCDHPAGAGIVTELISAQGQRFAALTNLSGEASFPLGAGGLHPGLFELRWAGVSRQLIVVTAPVKP